LPLANLLPVITSHLLKTRRSANQIITEIVNTASENIGVQYKTAGTTKAGYDCSGLVYSLLAISNFPHIL
jgi:cell wall-associated NlpC family hydrolase